MILVASRSFLFQRSHMLTPWLSCPNQSANYNSLKVAGTGDVYDYLIIMHPPSTAQQLIYCL